MMFRPIRMLIVLAPEPATHDCLADSEGCGEKEAVLASCTALLILQDAVVLHCSTL